MNQFTESLYIELGMIKPSLFLDHFPTYKDAIRSTHVPTILLLVASLFCRCTAIKNSSSSEVIANEKTRKITYLALGDSYTIGESVDPENNWPNQLANTLVKNHELTISTKVIAKTGWTSFELLEALDTVATDVSYNLVSLLIGVNNQYRGLSAKAFEKDFETLLQYALNKTGGDPYHIFVLSIPNYGFTPFGLANQDQITEEINQFNASCQRLCEAHNIDFYSITDITELGLKNPEWVANDGLHPSKLMYEKWVQRIENQVFEKLP